MLCSLETKSKPVGPHSPSALCLPVLIVEVTAKNNALRPRLEELRMETAGLYHHANELKTRWATVEEQQKAAYKVRLLNHIELS